MIVKNLFIFFIILFFNGVACLDTTLEILKVDIGQEYDGCQIDVHVAVRSNLQVSFVTSPSSVEAIPSLYQRVNGADIRLFSMRNTYSPGTTELSFNILFNSNSTTKEIFLGKMYNCQETSYQIVGLPNLPLNTKGKDSLFVRIPLLEKKVSPTVSWSNLKYSGTIKQNSYDLTLFELQIIQDPSITLSDIATNFTIYIGSTVVYSSSLSSPLKAFDQVSSLISYTSRESTYLPKRPYASSIFNLTNNLNDLWFGSSITYDGTYFVSEFQKGSPNSTTLVLTTLVYQMTAPQNSINSFGVYNNQGLFKPLSQGNIYKPFKTVSIPSILVSKVDTFFFNTTAYATSAFTFQSNAEIDLYIYAPVFEPIYSYQFPFGYSSGTLKDVGASVGLVLPPYFARFDISISVAYSDPSILSNPNIPFTIKDSQASTVYNLTLSYLSGPYYLLRANVSDLDTLSGLKFIEINSYRVLNSYDLVEGSFINGIFEAMVDFNYLLVADKITVCDNSLLQFSFDYGYYNVFGSKFEKIKGYDILKPLSITKFLFKNYNIDLSNNGQWNTLYFNYTGAGPYSRIIFYPIILVSEYSIDDPDIKVNPKYQYEWDLNLKMFKIDFYLPRGLYTKNITYYLGDLSNTGLHSSGLYSSNQLYKILGETALLSVYSSEANQMFPYFSKFAVKQSQAPVLLETETATIGWIFTVETLLHPLKYILITVTSDYDPQGRNYTLTPSDSLNESAYNGTYELLFNVSGASVSQEYKISYVLMEDESSRQSAYNQLYMADAFFLFVNMSTYSIKVDTTVVPTVTIAPNLATWTPNKESFSPMATNRSFEIQFSVIDSDSSLSVDHVPVVYLIPLVIDPVYKCSTTVLTMSSDKSQALYKATCDPGYGFGYPYGFSLSVYGLVNAKMSVKGYSGLNLNTNNFIHFFNISTPIAKEPFLEDVFVLRGAGELVLKGRNFGTGIDVQILQQNGGWQPIIIPSFNYYTRVGVSFNHTVTQSFDIRFFNNDGKFSNTVHYEYIENISDSSDSTKSSSGNEESSSQGTPTTPKPTTKPLCPNNCGGTSRGTCLETGGCKCIGNYYGEDCTSEIIIIPTPSIDTNTPTTTIIVPESGGKSVKVTSLISIISYNELDKDGNIVKNQTFNEWIYTNIKDGLYLYQTKIDNTTNVNVTIQYFTQATSIQFAGQTLTMNPSSIKYQISIDKYQFKSSLNQLQFIMSAALNTSNNDDKCTFNQFDNTIEDSEYLRLQIDNYSLYGRFIKVGLIDSRPRNIINSVVNIDISTVDQQQQQQQSTSTSTSSKYIGIVVPYYTQHAVIDPDFSVLIDSNTAKDKQGAVCLTSKIQGKTKLSGAQIAGIVIGCIGFTAVVVTAVVYSLYKTKKTKQLNIKMQNRLNEFNNNK